MADETYRRYHSGKYGEKEYTEEYSPKEVPKEIEVKPKEEGDEMKKLLEKLRDKNGR